MPSDGAPERGEAPSRGDVVTGPTICAECRHFEVWEHDSANGYCSCGFVEQMSYVTGEVTRTAKQGDYTTCSVRNPDGACPDWQAKEEVPDAE